MKTRKRKIVMVFLVLIFVFLILSLFYMARYTIKSIFNSIFPPTEVATVNLTEDEKIEDFEYLYNTIINSMPSIDNYEEAYGFRFRDRKEYYENLIRNTENDFEYYAVMDAIIQDVPSFHTDLLYPDSYNAVNCYNADRISSDRGVIAHSEYWCGMLENEKNENDCDFYSFLYNDGYYYFSTIESIADENILNCKLLTVNGVSVDEYIISRPFVYNLYYDGKNDKPCRTRVVFNSSQGQECKLTLLSESGDIIEYTLFTDIYLERIFLEKTTDIYKSDSSPSDFILLEDADVSYVKIDNMNARNGQKVKNMLENLSNENVILDLRENFGGHNQFAADYIYPYLFEDKITEKHSFYVPKSEANKCITENIFDIMMVQPNNTESNPFNGDIDMYICVKTNNYVGKIKGNKNVVILSSHHTGSAADTFIHDMRKNNLAYVIGNNTGGEGLNYSFVESKLPNSNLAFIYTPGGSYTFEGYDNSVYGTKPDYYIETTESFINYLNSNPSATFEMLCENDETLQYAYEYITNISH